MLSEAVYLYDVLRAKDTYIYPELVSSYLDIITSKEQNLAR